MFDSKEDPIYRFMENEEASAKSNGQGPAAGALISMEHIWKTYQMGAEELHALRDVSFKVEKGEYTLKNVLEDAKKMQDTGLVQAGYGFYPRTNNGTNICQKRILYRLVDTYPPFSANCFKLPACR